jgi:hypothetical protein
LQVPVVPADERCLDLHETAEIDLVQPRNSQHAQHIPQVGRMLKHQFHAVFLELANQVAGAALSWFGQLSVVSACQEDLFRFLQ